mmetsp:Transcript_26847/g.63697  ORF Transcript_26847/g.63697 Transcript_26847/m.63697 type:complete len:214 (+) Transcript_26847:5009-5650(+)
MRPPHRLGTRPKALCLARRQRWTPLPPGVSLARGLQQRVPAPGTLQKRQAARVSARQRLWGDLRQRNPLKPMAYRRALLQLKCRSCWCRLIKATGWRRHPLLAGEARRPPPQETPLGPRVLRVPRLLPVKDRTPSQPRPDLLQWCRRSSARMWARGIHTWDWLDPLPTTAAVPAPRPCRTISPGTDRQSRPPLQCPSLRTVPGKGRPPRPIQR